MICQMLPSSVTLNDPNPGFKGTPLFKVVISHKRYKIARHDTWLVQITNGSDMWPVELCHLPVTLIVIQGYLSYSCLKISIVCFCGLS